MKTGDCSIQPFVHDSLLLTAINTEVAFFQDFIQILKQMLHEMKTFFIGTISVVTALTDLNIRPNNSVLLVSKGLRFYCDSEEFSSESQSMTHFLKCLCLTVSMEYIATINAVDFDVTSLPSS